MRGGLAALLGAALAILLCLAAPGWAQRKSPAPGGALGLTSQDNGKPIRIEADNGIEWQQAKRIYIARGNATATRGQTSVRADTLYAYYRSAAAAGAGKNAAPVLRGNPRPQGLGALETGSTQVYRIEADGHVMFATPTQTAYGDHAIYDVDRALMVLTGKNLKIVTPQDTVTARDSFEWYDQKQIGVARGDAIAVRAGPPKKTIRADILIAEITKPPNEAARISKIDAHGHVVLTSQDQVAQADAAVYNLTSGIATLSGHVTLTRGSNVLRGQYAVVDTNRNVARLLSAPPSAKLTGPRPRVEGLLIPNDRNKPTRQ
jgi:lipopolysaccharide export system protein LptA